MPKDDSFDMDFQKLEKEIDSKVEALFVDSDMAQEKPVFEMEEEISSEMAEEEDDFNRLKEYFLTLDWEIDTQTLEGLSEEILRLEERYRGNTNVATLLGLMGKAINRIMEPGGEADRQTISFLNRAKEALFQIMVPKEDQISSPEEIVMGIEAQYEQFIGHADEEMRETVAVEQFPDIGLHEIEEVIDRAIRPEAEPLEEEVRPGLKKEEPISPPLEEEKPQEFEYYKKKLSEQSDQLRSLIERYSLTEDLLGHKKIFDKISQDIHALSRELIEIQEALRDNIERLSLVSFQPQKEAVEGKPQVKDLVFVSVANRIFAFPAESIEALFRVPMEYAPIVSRMKEIHLKDSVYPLVWLGDRIGIQKVISIFPKEERILLVRSKTGLKAMLVDKVIARQEVEVKEIGPDESQDIFSGIAIVPKGAFIVDSQLL